MKTLAEKIFPFSAEYASVDQASKQSFLGVRIGPTLWSVFVFTAAFNILLLTSPLFVTQLYSRVLMSNSIETLFVLTVGAIVAVAFAAVFDVVRLSTIQRLGQRIHVVLGEKAVQASLRPSLAASDREMPLQDVDVLRRFIGGRDLLTLMDVPFAAMFLFILFLIHPVIGSVATAMAALMLVLAIATDMLLSKNQRHVATALRNSASDFSSFGGNTTLLASMGMTTAVVIRWLRTQLTFVESLRRSESQTAALVGLSQVLRMTTQTVVLATSAFYVMQGELNPGMILASSILATRAVQPIDGMISGQRALRNARDAYARLNRLLQSAPPVLEVQHLLQTGAVKATQLVYSTGRGQPHVKGVSLSIAPGEIVGIVGPSGSGKSLVGQLLVGALEPTGGSVRVDDVDLKTSEANIRSSALGYLAQRVDVLPGTVAENIARFGNIDPDKVWKTILMVQVEVEIGKLQSRLDTPMAQAAIELSPGMFKRILLARAFYDAPKLVVLDEPLSDLDLEGERMLVSALGLLRDSGSTIVVISPRGNLMRLLDRVVVMKSGAIESIRNDNQLSSAGGLGRWQVRDRTAGQNVCLLGD